MKEFSTYSKEDVIFLLKDISNMIVEEDNLTRERKIQSGTHYSEMIPVEYQVSDEYLTLYREKLKENKEKLAFAIGVMSEKILKRHNQNPILVSLARAGTPIGILAKRYIKQRYNIDLPHYTISIIRDRGIDINAIKYIINKHKDSSKIQFIDGWTGKGTIANELKKACDDGCRVLAYCTWSYTDLLSWLNGYQKRYGFVYVDREEDENSGTLNRYKKDSYYWYKKVIETNGEEL